MGKRSNFLRRERDLYETPYEAVVPLIPFLRGIKTFAEPCVGPGKLVRHLESQGLSCEWASDIDTGTDALEVSSFGPVDAIITNPPWSRDVLHPMIEHFQWIAPTWLLFDADWKHTKQSAPFIDQCSHIVSVGRVKWIEGSKMTGKDNCAWYRFHIQHTGGPHFYGRASDKVAKLATYPAKLTSDLTRLADQTFQMDF